MKDKESEAMKQLFLPCPVCGGTQAFFNASSNAIYLSLGFLNRVGLGALICLDCGHTELRPYPGDMGSLRAEVEKRGLLPPD